MILMARQDLLLQILLRTRDTLLQKKLIIITMAKELDLKWMEIEYQPEKDAIEAHNRISEGNLNIQALQWASKINTKIYHKVYADSKNTEDQYFNYYHYF